MSETDREVMECLVLGPDNNWNPAPAPGGRFFFIRTKGSPWASLGADLELAIMMHGPDYEWCNVKSK